jgi:hypothetical protein
MNDERSQAKLSRASLSVVPLCMMPSQTAIDGAAKLLEALDAQKHNHSPEMAVP